VSVLVTGAAGFIGAYVCRDGLPPVVAWCRDYFGDGA
jgi:hypothetical protein